MPSGEIPVFEIRMNILRKFQTFEQNFPQPLKILHRELYFNDFRENRIRSEIYFASKTTRLALMNEKF